MLRRVAGYTLGACGPGAAKAPEGALGFELRLFQRPGNSWDAGATRQERF